MRHNDKRNSKRRDKAETLRRKQIRGLKYAMPAEREVQ